MKGRNVVIQEEAEAEAEDSIDGGPGVQRPPANTRKAALAVELR